MGSEWRKVKLAQLLEVKGGKRLPAGVNLVETPNDHPYIRVRDLSGVRTLELNAQCLFVDNETQKLIKNYIVAIGDIIISIVGTIGLVAIVGKSLEKANLTENCVKLTNLDGVELLYLYYFLKSPLGQNEIAKGTVGAVQAKLPIKNILDIELDLPPIVEQRFIAATLSCLDDKIELNNRIIANLEAQAQAIFKSWFVDFEPFQDGEFEDSELGLIPKGWRVSNLLEIANYLNGLAMQNFRPEVNDEGLPVLKIKELRQGFCDNSSDRCTSKLESKYIVHDGDVIFSWSGSLLIDLWCSGDCGLNQHLFKVTSKEYQKWFYYMWTKHHLDVFVSLAADKATTMGHIKREALENALIVIPNAHVIKETNAIFEPLIDSIILKRIENREITLVRDTLLPKLMSGEIEVSEEG